MIAYPDDLYYTREREWIRVEDNIAMIGITDFAQSELGEYSLCRSRIGGR